MIELKNLYKSYRGKSVLMNISLTIQDNEFFCPDRFQRMRENDPVENAQQAQPH